MPFATDRDLLVLEPNLLRDVAHAGQRRASATDAAIAGVTLTSDSSDFEAAAVDKGAVALVNDLPHEVVERTSPTELLVSLIRDQPDGALIQPPQVEDSGDLKVYTFAPQIDAAHDNLAASLGLTGDEQPTTSDVVNAAELARLEALGALAIVYTGAAALASPDDPLWARASFYRDRFAQQRRRVVAWLDLDGDGHADALRSSSSLRLVRE